MNPLSLLLPEARRCAGDGCTSGPRTWPLQYARHQGVLCRLCCSCLLLSHRSLYCCCCFQLLNDDSSSDNDDPIISPDAPTVPCIVCRKAIAHFSCIHSPSDVFLCPACKAAALGRPFSYMPSSMALLDMQGTQVILLSTKIALQLLKAEASQMRVLGERMAVESMEARKQAYHALSMAFGIDHNPPSVNEHISSPENMRPQGGELHIDMMKLDLNEPPPTSPGMLAVGTEGVHGGMAMASNYEPTLSSMAMFTLGNENVCEEFEVTSREFTLQMFWKDNDEAKDDDEE
ncbi:hypothetical protein VPH35_103607 [Triticum aestivum]|uniref:Uncharacterized protein n=1 Tax=Triticum aestivum TaxID=4565 RepID=A0A3B6NLV5_WHEAT|nr:uncharacterized protein LOC123130353 [Triticum aestivum]